MTELVGDIGGTNARFGLVSQTGGSVSEVMTLACKDYASLETAIARYLADAGVESVTAACIAVAGPVTGDRVRFSNRGWEFSRKGLMDGFGLERMLLLNDFEALAYSLPFLKPGELDQIGGGKPVEGAPKVVVGPGTGLGVAGLAWSGDDWVAIAGEGGHVELAATDDWEFEVLKVVRAERGRVSAESLLSGPGLKRLYRAICSVEGVSPLPLEEKDIGGYAQDGGDDLHKKLCRKTIEAFVSMLAGFAGNLALTFGARGGVYLGGGVLGKLSGFYSDLSFRQRFEAKGRMSDLVRSMPTFLITAATPALTGAASRLSAR